MKIPEGKEQFASQKLQSKPLTVGLVRLVTYNKSDANNKHV